MADYAQEPWFARSIVNRVWAWLLGRGIIHEPDDIRDNNPPSNPALLAYLEKELVASHYDLKHVYRLILNSSTYQLSSLPRFKGPQAEANFASYPLRRLDAEVLIDAINKITGTTDLYTSPIPEPFTYIPPDKPAIAIADGSITSPFLTLFGRSARATGMENERHQRARPRPVAAHAEFEPYPAQARPGPEDQGDHRVRAANCRRSWTNCIGRYFPRPPTRGGVEIGPWNRSPLSTGHCGKRPIDVAWALINSREFLYRH